MIGFVLGGDVVELCTGCSAVGLTFFGFGLGFINSVVLAVLCGIVFTCFGVGLRFDW